MNEFWTEPSTSLRNCRAWQQPRVDVDAVGVQRDRARRDPAVVDRHEHQVDVGLCPDGIVRQAAAEDRSKDAVIVLQLHHERVECRRECLPG